MADVSTMTRRSSSSPLWLLVVEGVAAIVIGFFFLFQPANTLLAIGILLAVFWLIHGIAMLVSLSWNRTVWGWKVFIGALGVIVGVSILQAPLVGTAALSVALAILLGAYGLIAGILEIYMGIDNREGGKIVIGVLTFVLGFVFMLYPVIGIAVISSILGAISIFAGILALWLGFSFQRSREEIQHDQEIRHA